MFKLFTTTEFDEEFADLDKSEQIKVKKILKQIKERRDEVGDPLSGLSFFREKRFGGKRVYFLIYKDMLVVLAIGISDKKAQQSTINKILIDLANYQQYVIETLKKEKR